MQALIKAGLYGKGLIHVNSRELVARYNACLVSMNLPTTNLKEFHIDGLGWSPEIAQEKNNAYYLAHGMANPLGIILTPKQRHAAIYNPYHSFDWDLMVQYYRDHSPQIATVTQFEGICLDIDQEVNHYVRSADLLMVGNIIVKSWTPSELMKKVATQKALVHAFMNEQDVTKLYGIAKNIQTSAKEVGDMRYRAVEITDMQYSQTRTFFSRAFGGTFVVRDIRREMKPLLINKKSAKKKDGVTSNLDQSILRRLEEMGLIDYDPYWWKEGGRLYRLRTIRDSFLMDVLDEDFPDLVFVELSAVEQKSYINKVKDKLPKEYFQLARVIKKLEDGGKTGRIAKSIKPFFAHMPEGVDQATIEVIWYLLALVCDGRSIVRLYRYDKEGFFEAYNSWNTPKKTWAIAAIKYYNETH